MTMAYKPQGPPKPGKFGVITDPLMNKNIGIDNKILMLIDDRLGMAREMDLKLGEQVEYKQLSQGIDKGKINFIKRAEGYAPTQQQPAAEKPAPAPVSHLPPDTQDIQAEYVSKDGMTIHLKDCMGDEQKFTADLYVIKLISKENSEVQSGKKYKVRLIKQGDNWIVTKMGNFDDTFGEKPFRTAKEILQQNISEQKAEVAQADSALAQINKEIEQADARTRENVEYAKSLIGAEKPMPTTEPPKEPEKRPQNDTVTVPAGSITDSGTGTAPTLPFLMDPKDALPINLGPGPNAPDPLKECPVELKIHLDCGSYSNIDLTQPGLPIDQAIVKIEADAMKAIAMMHRLMAASKKGY
jgi:hypothetical protein